MMYLCIISPHIHNALLMPLTNYYPLFPLIYSKGKGWNWIHWDLSQKRPLEMRTLCADTAKLIDRKKQKKYDKLS